MSGFNGTIDIMMAEPSGELAPEEEQKVIDRIIGIIERGNVAVLTRPHRIFPDITVTKRISKFAVNKYGDIATDDGGAAAPWDPAYVITEEKK